MQAILIIYRYSQNLKYNLALQKAINSMKSLGKTTHVLDIGTGTGLLAMMGAKANADTVTACEVLAVPRYIYDNLLKTHTLSLDIPAYGEMCK